MTNEELETDPNCCIECGDNSPIGIDCATHLCEMCFEHIMGPDAEGFEP